MPPTPLLAADRNQQFADWSEPITLRTITQAYDPETLEITESAADITIDALIGTLPQTPTPDTAGQHHTQHLTATVKREHLPALAPHPLTRIVWNAAQYEVIDAIDSPTAQLTTLHARKIP